MEKDPRVIKTKKAIEDAFVSLVESKSYKNVKLVDIAEKARINRNTIYLHYGSKEDIITSIIAESIEKELAAFDLQKFYKSRFNRFKTEEFYKALFASIDKNAELYRILLLEDELIGFFNIAIKKIKKNMLMYFKNTPKNSLVIDYLLYGIFGVVNSYTVYATGTAKENIKLLTDLTMASIRRMQI